MDQPLDAIRAAHGFGRRATLFELVDVGTAMALFGVQLVLNTAWSLIFFGLQRPGLAAAEIVQLGSAIAATLVAFARVNRTAAAQRRDW